MNRRPGNSFCRFNSLRPEPTAIQSGWLTGWNRITSSDLLCDSLTRCFSRLVNGPYVQNVIFDGDFFPLVSSSMAGNVHMFPFYFGRESLAVRQPV